MTELTGGLQEIFERNSDDFQRLVGTLEEAVAALLAGNLDEGLRSSAERDAHKLTGSLGTFGLARGSELARRLEQRFAPSAPVDVAHAGELVGALRRELEGGLAGVRVDEGLKPPSAGLTPAQARALTAARILVVDDDAAVGQLMAGILSEAGHDVRYVGSAGEARHVLQHDAIDLLFTDVRMPGETGLDLIRFALCEHPETATLLISAVDDPGIAQVALDFGVYGYLTKPVRRSAVLIGVMNALRRRDMEARERATREDLERTIRLRTGSLSRALEQLAGADERGRVLQAETVHRWAAAAEHRDPGISGHVIRVGRYCGVLGSKLGLDPAALDLASVLHDVGKTAIPDAIMRKPAPLTADEHRAIETHAEIGYGMLAGTRSPLLDLAAAIARTHHEKFDGRGYPHGLSGEQIPLAGRIAAAADVFDAMTCDRVYRPAWSVETTTAWLRHERGGHFDPVVVDAFEASLEDILSIRSRPGTGIGT
jgi:putative two-component system response regulator